MSHLLEIRDLSVEFETRKGPVVAVARVDFSLKKGETLGIVGESGSGKSVTSFATMRILDRAGKIVNGSIRYSGMELTTSSEREMQDLRGREISMIFQNPRAALNPIRTVGKQIEDVLLQHVQTTRGEAKRRAIEALEQVRIANPHERYNAYPFELSGGMCQRVVIAIALACNPQLLIADEPTTGLDVTTQKAIMDLIRELSRERALSTILITHDLGLAAAYCDQVVVMEKGHIVENSTAKTIFGEPEHEYTRRLFYATPRPGITLRELLPEGTPPKVAPPNNHNVKKTLLEVRNLLKEYPRGKVGLIQKWRGTQQEFPVFRAVNGINFNIQQGETVGLVGESGCGKSTTSMMIMRLLDSTAGEIIFDGQNIADIPAKQFAAHPLRRRIQMVFQDPTDSLNPRYTAARAIADPILRAGSLAGKDELRARCEELAMLVGLPINLLDRLPHQLSGGQKARVGIARALALNPDLVILDEPTAALDVSVQAVVLNLLQDLKEQLKMSYLFVSHDLHVVRLLCDRAIVMKSGEIVEQGPCEQVLEAPKAAYTRELLAAIPKRPEYSSGAGL